MPIQPRTTLIVLGALLAASPTLGSSLAPKESGLPRITTNTPYPQVRRKLLKEGWKPVRRIDPPYSQEWADWMSRIPEGRYPEVQDCAGTGRGFCLFKWRRGSKCIDVVTWGEHDASWGPARLDHIALGDCY